MRDNCCGTQEREDLERGDSGQLQGLRSLIEQTYGLVYDGPDSGLLSQAIADRMQETGIESLASYCSFVLSSPAGADELRLLVDAATVKETRFFRGKGLFYALANEFVPDIIGRMRPASRGGRSVRAWSAGCATGEEAYSLALILIEAARGRYLSPVRVVGTDVSVSALAQATSGVYYASALRNVDESLLERHFAGLPADGEPVDHAGPCSWSVRYRVGPELAACVEFSEHNLAVMPYPERLREFDLILCRNVLMYFSMGTAARVTRELSRCLCQGGYLVLDSLVPPFDLEADDCRVVQCEHGIIIQKTGRRRLYTQARTCAQSAPQSEIATLTRSGAQPPIQTRTPGCTQSQAQILTRSPAKPQIQTSAPTQPSVQAVQCSTPVAGTEQTSAPPDAKRAHVDVGQKPQQPQWPHRPHRPHRPHQPHQLHQPTGPVRPGSEDRLEEAKAAADREDFEHALSLLESLRQDTPCDPRVHRLMGEIYLQLSDPRAASYCFARLLYLDPNNAVAHWRMADASEQMGRHDDELRHLCNALKCLESSDSLEQLELPSDVLVKACSHRIERLRLRQRI